MVFVSGNEQGICSAYELMCTKLEAGEDGNQSKNLNLRYNHYNNNPIYILLILQFVYIKIYYLCIRQYRFPSF